MADETDSPKNETPEAETPPEPEFVADAPPPLPRLFSQDEVNRLMARARAEGRRSALREVQAAPIAPQAPAPTSTPMEPDALAELVAGTVVKTLAALASGEPERARDVSDTPTVKAEITPERFAQMSPHQIREHYENHERELKAKRDEAERRDVASRVVHQLLRNNNR